ncbi:ribose 5-phosphate isomerase B [candidate division KSB1 bacterium]
MVIAIGNDHRAYTLKKKITRYLKDKNINYLDMGSDSEDSCDYPDFGYKTAKVVSSGEADLGILLCSNGIGMSIVANKVKGVRAALCSTPQHGKSSRTHNNANVLVIGDDSPGNPLEILDAWLNAEFESSGRHGRRVKKIRQLTGL